MERFTFADDERGLVHAINRTLSLRAAGYKTRLVRHHLCATVVLTVVAVSPKRPTRRERGCELRQEAR